jgi:hypothetical protein
VILQVSYELHNHDRDYPAVQKALQSATAECHPQNGVWLIDTLDSVSSWRDRLLAAGDPKDEIIVTRLHAHEWASANPAAGLGAWMKDDARRW